MGRDVRVIIKKIHVFEKDLRPNLALILVLVFKKIAERGQLIINAWHDGTNVMKFN